MEHERKLMPKMEDDEEKMTGNKWILKGNGWKETNIFCLLWY